ncbi:MAG TPA: acylphosphatase [Geothrix sp.]|nr:acylphosphatase [Geothrix sp.]
MQIAFRVQGAVQGVGYRRFAAREAQALALAGWVRNEPDGSVAGEAEGPEAALATFRARLAEGPPFAAVARLDWKALDMRSSLPFPFEIHR